MSVEIANHTECVKNGKGQKGKELALDIIFGMVAIPDDNHENKCRDDITLGQMYICGFF